MHRRSKCLKAIALLMIITSVVAPSIAYDESQFELCAGNLLFQDQFYTTSPQQTLFHSQMAAGTDTEALAFSPLYDKGFTLAQTSAGSLAATQCGFYTATFSFLKFSCPTAGGYMHTSIGDPIVSRTPVFSSLIFPDMIKMDRVIEPASPIQAAAGGAEANRTATNVSAGQAAPGMPAINRTGNATLSNMTVVEPQIKMQISSVDVGVPGRVNILAVTPTPSPRTAPVLTGNISAVAGAANATPTPAPMPLPLPESQDTIVPKAEALLAKPMSRQANKPFTDAIDPDYNPRKASRSQVRNITAWDRLTTNVIGRSGIDSTYMNRTSYPGYINPWNSVKLANQFNVMSDSVNMTRQGSYLQPRLWAL